jgi:excisionase family DNA binding protein
MLIVDLAVHPHAFVTIAELASYWRVSQATVLEYVRTGRLEAILLGAGLYRVRTTKAHEFETSALVHVRQEQAPPVPRRQVAQSSAGLLRCVTPRSNGNNRTR